METTNSRFKTEETRGLLALAVAMDPKVAPLVRQLFRMGAYNIRHDFMYVKNPKTGEYDHVPDPCAFNANLDAFGRKNSMGVCLLRTRDGEWFLNGC